jgi:fermentation-respiration switch protein FrsA (DUF1100 family)
MDVTISSVVFPAGGVWLAGRLHRAGDAFVRRPGVVVTGSWLTVKEQMADRYASGLARRGYTALTFDLTGWGESGGEPRHVETPTSKIADIAAACEFLSSRSFVAQGGVGYVAVCASAQYALTAVAVGAPIRSFAAVAGWFHDTATVAPFYGDKPGVEGRLRRADAATERFVATGEVLTVPAYSPGDDRAGMFTDMDYYANPARGAVPSWPNIMAEMSWQHWLTFDGLSAADRLTAPALFVHSDGCVFPDIVRDLARGVRGPVEVAWGDGTQTDFYDQPDQVRFAVEAVDRHLTATMAPGEEVPA